MGDDNWWTNRFEPLHQVTPMAQEPDASQGSRGSTPAQDEGLAAPQTPIPSALPAFRLPRVVLTPSGSTQSGQSHADGPPAATPSANPGAKRATDRPSIIDTGKLGDAFKWAAGGFTALVAVLTFFGIKEGSLDQALRLFPAQTLAIFAFLGIGVVTALFAPAIEPAFRSKRWMLYSCLIAMFGVAAIFYPNMGDGADAQQAPLDGASPDTGLGLNLWFVAAVILVLVTVTLTIGVQWDRTKAREASSSNSRRRFWSWVLGCVAAGVAVLVVVWRISSPEYAMADTFTGQQRYLIQVMSAGAFLTLALLAAVSFVRNSVLPTMAALVILAVAATSLGLYGATKVALESKSLSVLPQVNATIETGDGGTVVAISAKAGHLRGKRLIVELVGIPRDSAPPSLTEPTASKLDADTKPIWAGMFQPDALDDINQAVKVPISPTRWKSVTIKYCSVSDRYPGPPSCNDAADAEVNGGDVSGTSVMTVRNRAPETGIAQVGGHITQTSEGKLQAKFTAVDVSPGLLTRVELCRMHSGQHMSHVSDATLSPDGDGKIAWEATVPAGAAGTRLMLRHSTCPPGAPCKVVWRTIATYVTE